MPEEAPGAGGCVGRPAAPSPSLPVLPGMGAGPADAIGGNTGRAAWP